MQIPCVHADHSDPKDGNDLKPPEKDQKVSHDDTTQKESQQRDSSSMEGRDSILSGKRLSFGQGLDDLRRHVNDSIRRENDERFTQVEALGRRLEEERADCGLKLQKQDDRIVALESSYKQLDLKQKVQSEQIESEHALFSRDTEGFGAQIDSLNREREVRDNELRALTQRFEETSAECNVKFEESQTRHAEVLKICRKNNERCSQLEELTQRLERQMAEPSMKLEQLSEIDQTAASPVNFETFRDQFESRLVSERNTCKELIDAVCKSHASALQDLSASFDARMKDITSRLDAECADRQEKLEGQEQLEISRRTLEARYVEEMRSQRKLIEAESASREQLANALGSLIAQTSDRESTERRRQLQDLESRVEAEVKKFADMFLQYTTHMEANSITRESSNERIEDLASPSSSNPKLLAQLRTLNEDVDRRLETNSAELIAKVDEQNSKIEQQQKAHSLLSASHQQLTNAHQQLTLLFQSVDDATKDLNSKHTQLLKMWRKNNEK